MSFSRSLLTKPKSEMSPEELQKREEEEFNTGPLSVLTQSVKNNTQVLINCRNNKKLLGRVKAFDRYPTFYFNDIEKLRVFLLLLLNYFGMLYSTSDNYFSYKLTFHQRALLDCNNQS